MRAATVAPAAVAISAAAVTAAPGASAAVAGAAVPTAAEHASGGGGDRDRAPRSDRPSQGFSGGEGRPVDAKRGERHQANASLSASDVLRKASDQQAVVGNDSGGLRPKAGSDFEAQPQESFAPRA